MLTLSENYLPKYYEKFGKKYAYKSDRNCCQDFYEKYSSTKNVLQNALIQDIYYIYLFIISQV